MKKLIAFLMALGMVLAVIPMESSQARGRGRGGGARIPKGSTQRAGGRDRNGQEMAERRKREDAQSLQRDRIEQRRQDHSRSPI